MNRFDLNTESKKWEHPYRIQVSKQLCKWELASIIEDLNNQGISFAVEQRKPKFVIWREPEQEWDVDQASLEWIKEWTSHQPPPLMTLIEKSQVQPKYGDEANMAICENRLRRDNAIRTEFDYLKNQGFKSGHIYKVLAEKYYLSPLRIRDIVTSVKERTP